MILVDYDFYDFEPEDFMSIDISSYSDIAIREMAYFIWTMFPDDLALLLWRKEKLLPLIKVEDLIYRADAYE